MDEFEHHLCKNVQVNWDELRYVLAIKREGSLSAAADVLGVSRATVGRRLVECEARLGTRLFERLPDKLLATPAGDELAETAGRIEKEVLASEGRLVGRDDTLHGSLRVSILGFLFDGFPDVFSSFIDRYPQIELTVHATSEQESLIRREADVALRLDNHPHEQLVGRRVGKMHFEAYVSRKLANEVGADATLADYPWLSWEERPDEIWLEQWLAEHAPGAKIRFRTNDYGVLRKAIGLGIGAHFLPSFDGDADPTLVSLGVRLADETRDLWLLTLRDLRHQPRIRAFMDHVYEAFQAQPDRLQGRKSLP